MKLYAHTTHGVTPANTVALTFDAPSRATLSRYLAALPDGQRLEVDVRKPTKRRTLPQNARMWAGITLIAEHTGHTKEEVHDYLKSQFATDRSKCTHNDPIPHVLSTAKMTTTEHCEYVDRCEAWSIQMFDIAFPTMEDDR